MKRRGKFNLAVLGMIALLFSIIYACTLDDDRVSVEEGTNQQGKYQYH